ncbi:MAG: NAD(P)-binding domain-containing protein, partial [Acidobacteriota bacterium]
MQMLLTTTGFFLLTAVMVARHLRRRTPVSGPAAPCRSSGPACPRCKSALPVSATFCPGCGTPQQLYEVTRIKAVPENAGTALSQGKPHAVVLAEKCVGCATCVARCPIPGAIRMEQKLAVVDLSVCQGIADCAAACPMGAIVVTTGDAVQRLEVPEVHTDFQTNVPGLYIAGELGGRGLIKNAINEGKLAVENIAQALPPGEKRSDGVAEALDLAIVGGGPAGISAALEAHRIGLSYVVLEQGSLADTIRKYPRRKLLLAEPVKIPLYGDLWVADSSKETLLQVWDSIIENTHLRVKTGHRVEKIVRDGPFFHLEAAGTPFKARCLLLAIGRRGTPRRLGIPGEDLDKVFYDVVEME